MKQTGPYRQRQTVKLAVVTCSDCRKFIVWEDGDTTGWCLLDAPRRKIHANTKSCPAGEPKP